MIPISQLELPNTKIGAMLPENIKGELPSIEEIEQKLDKELQEQQNPVDARLKAIKEKLKGIETDEIRTPATHEILLNLFRTWIKTTLPGDYRKDVNL